MTKIIPRSAWTPNNPFSHGRGDRIKGLDFWEEQPQVTFHRPDTDVVFLHREPGAALQTLLKADMATHLSDFNYNYAITQNTDGMYTIRGCRTKCSDDETMRVLMLIGNNEEPTDQLKVNQGYFSEPLAPSLPKSVIAPNQSDVHVHDLIEWLSAKGYYHGRNAGIYDQFVVSAIFKLQVDLEHSDPNGIYDHWTYHRAQHG
jgi:hypothetical protein